VWKDICEVIGKPEWLTDPKYATPKAAAAPDGDSA
jgi:crotonobetainyl-CoA:carnitine CoA-transferase CaiB-like acyl-CoA transferase